MSRKNRIRYVRIRLLNLTQKEFAKIIGISGAGLSLWERDDKINIQYRNLQAIAEAGKVPIEWITDGPDDDIPELNNPPASDGLGDRVTKNRSSTGSPNIEENPEIVETLNARELALTVIEVAFLRMLNRTPTAGEQESLVGASLRLYSSRRVLAEHELERANVLRQIPSATQGRINGQEVALE